ncbi:hypothetical protein AB0J57_19420 [Streptomyces sp. NPDC049837]|uniref:hypothetical protein n=1 Tax=Streptomyces sp. NPDC049837 TaxID=3155277 RepID=UPI003420DA1E
MTPSATATPQHKQQPECTHEQRQAALREDQRRVLELIGEEHRVLNNSEELRELGRPRLASQTAYNFLDHRFASARNMGVGIVDTLEPVEGAVVEPGRPDVLLYAPDPRAENVIDPDGPDFPYTLVGWAYAPSGYSYADWPQALPCIERADWFVHERSIHPADTWQNIPAPPRFGEAFPGAEPNELPILPDECTPAPCPPGLQHPRIWDIHFWLGSGGVPSLSILKPGRPIRGWDPEVGRGFFYPPLTPPTTSTTQEVARHDA